MKATAQHGWGSGVGRLLGPGLLLWREGTWHLVLGWSYPSGRGCSGSAGVGCTVQQVTAVERACTGRQPVFCSVLPSTSSLRWDFCVWG